VTTDLFSEKLTNGVLKLCKRFVMSVLEMLLDPNKKVDKPKEVIGSAIYKRRGSMIEISATTDNDIQVTKIWTGRSDKRESFIHSTDEIHAKKAEIEAGLLEEKYKLIETKDISA